MLSEFENGNPELQARLNEVVAVARKVENISGGGEVKVQHTASGITINVERRRVSGSGEGTTIRWVEMAEDATADDNIKGSLLDASGVVATAGDDFEADIYFEMLNSTRTDMCIPRLLEDDIIPVVSRVYDNSGTPETRWYFLGVLYGSTDYWDET